MKTEVIMKRELFGSEIQQKSKSEFFSATDLVRAGNKKRIGEGKSIFLLSEYLRTKQTKEFIETLEKEYGKVVISGKGRGKHTWVHPFVFMDIALSLDSSLKISVYKWMYDYLLKYRNSSGDSYKKMAGALWLNCSNRSIYPKLIKDFASKIKETCNVCDWNEATEEQLKLRDKIHNNIALLSDILKDKDQLLEVSIKKALN
jgi:hypothetical protein